jgi:hypothetical protein
MCLLNSRFNYMTGDFIEWPICDGSTDPGPTCPPGGYYACWTETGAGAALAQALVDGLALTCGYYLKDPRLNPTYGVSNETLTLEDLDIPYVTNDNWREVIGAVGAAVGRLTHVLGTASAAYIDSATHVHRHGWGCMSGQGPGNCTSCEKSRELAIERQQQEDQDGGCSTPEDCDNCNCLCNWTDWTGSGNGSGIAHFIEYLATTKHDCPDNSDETWDTYIDVSVRQMLIQVENPGFGTGSATVLILVDHYGTMHHPSEPVAADGKWHVWQSVDTPSQVLTDVDRLPADDAIQDEFQANLTLEGCSGNGVTLTAGWGVPSGGVKAIIACQFDTITPSGTPCECDVSTADWRNARTAPTVKHTSKPIGTSDLPGCGNGGPGKGGGGGKKKSPNGGAGKNPGNQAPGEGDSRAEEKVEYTTMPVYELYPVDLTSGDKSESTIDLDVPYSGGSYTIARSYNSSTSLGGAGLVGPNWSLSCFGFLRTDGSNIVMAGEQLQEDHVFVPNGTNLWKSAGASKQTLSHAQLAVDDSISSTAVDTYRLDEPGEWQVDYYRGGALNGLVLEERDSHGNCAIYQYTVYHDSTNSSNPDQARLAAVYLRPSGSGTSLVTSDAIIRFYWSIHTIGLNAEPYDDRHTFAPGQLIRVEVQRFDGLQYRMVEQVTYSYLYGTTVGTAAASTHLGIAGDLVEVIKSSLVNRVEAGGPGGATAPYRTQITQYRYHATDRGAGSDSNEILNARGRDHQLKMIIAPEQIEYLAQLRTFGSIDADEALRSAARNLLATDDGSNLDIYGGPTTKPIDLAAKIIAYESSTPYRVKTEYVQAGCGCSSSHGMKLVFDYASGTDGAGPWQSVRVQESKRNSSSGWVSHQTRYHDLRPHRSDANYRPSPVTHVIEDPNASGTPRWIRHAEYDSVGRLVRMMTPAAASAYSPSDFATTSPSAPTYSASTSAGRVYAISYKDFGPIEEVRIRNGNHTDFGEFQALIKVVYPSSNGSGVRTYLPSSIEEYVDATTTPSSLSADRIQTTTFTYGFHGADSGAATTSHTLAWIRTDVEAESTVENGPNGSGNTYGSTVLFDTTGRTRWVASEDNSLSYLDYASRCGRVAVSVQNADPAQPNPDTSSVTLSDADKGWPAVSGWSSWGKDGGGQLLPGGDLRTTYFYDILGRGLGSKSPSGVIRYSTRELRRLPSAAWSSTGGLEPLFREVLVSWPAMLPSGGADGPVTLMWMNGGGKPLQTSDFTLNSETHEIDPGLGVYPFDVGTLSPDSDVARSRNVYKITGLLDQSKQWGKIPSTYDSAEIIYTTSYFYDTLGRTEQIDTNEGGVTKYVYDVLNRVTEIQVGRKISSSYTTLTPVIRNYYDSGTSTTQGVGNGNLTRRDQLTGEPSSGGTPFGDGE